MSLKVNRGQVLAEKSVYQSPEMLLRDSFFLNEITYLGGDRWDTSSTGPHIALFLNPAAHWALADFQRCRCKLHAAVFFFFFLGVLRAAAASHSAAREEGVCCRL